MQLGCRLAPHHGNIESDTNHALLAHKLDSTTYYINVAWTGDASLKQEGNNTLILTPASDEWDISATNSFAKYWKDFWTKGGVVDFSHCTDPRAKELERRVVLSQYLLAIQCAGSTPPQETGLTYNSWFGKFHMEMI